MFRFEEPAYLYLLLLLPLLAAFYLYSNYRRRKAIRKFGDPILMAQLMPDVSKYRPDVKFWLVFAAIGLFTVLLARPQFGSKLETVKRQGVEVMIALDISNSMLAQDVQPSRLQKAKRLVAQLVDKMQIDKVGIPQIDFGDASRAFQHNGIIARGKAVVGSTNLPAQLVASFLAEILISIAVADRTPVEDNLRGMVRLWFQQ